VNWNLVRIIMEKSFLDFMCTVYYFSFILLDLEAPCSVRQLSSSFRWPCVGSEKELALLGFVFWVQIEVSLCRWRTGLKDSTKLGSWCHYPQRERPRFISLACPLIFPLPDAGLFSLLISCWIFFVLRRVPVSGFAPGSSLCWDFPSRLVFCGAGLRRIFSRWFYRGAASRFFCSRSRVTRPFSRSVFYAVFGLGLRVAGLRLPLQIHSAFLFPLVRPACRPGSLSHAWFPLRIGAARFCPACFSFSRGSQGCNLCAVFFLAAPEDWFSCLMELLTSRSVLDLCG
jgi:hypothetical protein